MLHRLFLGKEFLGTVPNCAMDHMGYKPPLMDHCVCKNLDDEMFRKIPTLVDEA